MDVSKSRPRVERLVLVGLIGAALGAAATVTFTQAQGTVAAVMTGVTGAVLAGAVGAVAARADHGPFFAFTGYCGLVVVAGPLLAGASVMIRALVQGEGGAESVLAIPIFGVLGMMCGWFITIPVGLVLGLIMALVAWIASRALPDRPVPPPESR